MSKIYRVSAVFLVVLTLVNILAGCSAPPIEQVGGNETVNEIETTGKAEESTAAPETDTVVPETDAETQQQTTAEVTMEPIIETVEPDGTEPPIPETQPVPETQPPIPGYVNVTGITLTFYEVKLTVGEVRMPIVTMSPWNATDKGEIWTSSDTAVATVDIYGNIKAVATGECIVTVTSTANGSVSANVAVTVAAEPVPTYIDGILVVNKTYALPKSYAPGWDAEASDRLWAMFAAAKAEGYSLRVQSGYRSYVDQNIIYNNYVAQDGQANADRYSARPGHSEHQTGLAFDLNTYYYNGLTQEFGQTPEGIWLAQNCHKYGFIIRYPQNKESITGYMYEPWHVRYLGVDKATAVYESGLCLEEYLGITSSYS